MTEKKILIVDDDDLLLTVMKRYLVQRGYKHVLAVSTGEDSIEAASQTCFNTVILDINLPGIDGWQVLERVKSMSPDTEVIMITGSSAEANRYRSIQNGAFALLEKPFALEELDRMLQCTFRSVCTKRIDSLRAVCQMPSKIIHDGLEFNGIMENMSESGVLIKIDVPCNHFQIGSGVDVVFLAENSSLTMKGEIARQNGNGSSEQISVGVRLINPSRSYLNLLDYLLAV